MKDLLRIIRPGWLGIASPFFLYGFIVLFLSPFYRFAIGPDAISYFSIARHYAQGNWAEAVNPNWGPLYCWLLAPLLAAGMPDPMAGRLVCALSGLAALYAALCWTRRMELGSLTAFLMTVSAVMVASYALMRMGPDLLLGALVLFYLLATLDWVYTEPKKKGLLCGALGALLYFTKAYGLAFFLAHFVLITVLQWFSRRDSRAALLKQFALGLALFTVLVAPWILAMSRKAGTFMMGTTGDFNYRLVGPASGGYPQYGELIPPPGEHAVSMWEQPDPALLPAWKPYQSLRTLRHQIRILAENVKSLIGMTLEVSVLSCASIFAYAVLGLSGLRDRDKWWLVVASLMVYPAGYLLVIVQDRYLWGWFLLILILGTAAAQAIIDGGWLSRPARWLFLGVFALSFLQLPLRQMIAQRNSGRALFELSQRIGQPVPLRGNVAACEHWNDSLGLAYYLRLRFYGTTGLDAEEIETERLMNADSPAPSTRSPETKTGEITRQLAANNVDYYFAWNNCAAPLPPSVLAHEEITQGRIPELRIYRLAAGAVGR